MALAESVLLRTHPSPPAAALHNSQQMEMPRAHFLWEFPKCRAAEQDLGPWSIPGVLQELLGAALAGQLPAELQLT